ncbi:serine/threonine-protein phosphatase [Streptomyces sp. NBC_00237]|uniref:PP2C family protein-serine/threonine phosphatase n=1 Tax=Streptomyces sp. NBC_00237 TaxID=2975687 RepID=UPI00225188CC|nr:PP2C family protein-serine/threonine phosphatase [Streptomyces sp. NBC_00237]MCX5201668.1 serine/threonine-protein phosphatase [Streptomyces sp. NBC_00237]
MSSVRARQGQVPRWQRGEKAPLWLRLLPLVVLVLLALADRITPDDVELSYFVAALPPLAALLYGPVSTALMGAAVLFYAQYDTGDFAHQDGVLLSLVLLCVTSVVVSWSRTRREALLVTVGTAAEVAQFAVLPPLPAVVGRVHCFGLYRAAELGALVSGDLYDVRAGPNGVRAVVADVEGHGPGAVATVSALLGAFREAALDDADLPAVAARLDRRLVVDSAAVEHAELFATAVLMEFAEDGLSVRVVSCGHPPPLLLRDGRVSELRLDPAPPLGLGLTGFGPPQVTVVPLEPCDRILAHTDGITEARNAEGAFYPLRERLAALDPSEGELADLAEAVQRDLVRFAKNVEDDVALLLVEPDSDNCPDGPEAARGSGPAA